MKKARFGRIVCIVAVFCVATAIASLAQTLNTLADFDGTDGLNINGPLVQGTDGNFYGNESGRSHL
jgi:hypothetical protein